MKLDLAYTPSSRPGAYAPPDFFLTGRDKSNPAGGTANGVQVTVESPPKTAPK